MFSVAEAHGTRRFGPHEEGDSSVFCILKKWKRPARACAPPMYTAISPAGQSPTVKHQAGFGASGPALRQADGEPFVCEPSSECKTGLTS